ncbi:tripartite ATP-independent transporter solute receptor, DctP family [Thalassobacillus cyri]|uniref:Tripartite ATP-independent transporter solute receptor, DctP family n=1 Tax=Thalassobacillus cyri TaxID=571932 RepID=A0A1H4E4A7_9BACI|nr:TRAP transporter substrate-binding protein [Thalassobacillus cyri]SEA79390.1 tripartite ATP-independent transporter solute receptor, DctP family [Thalassobacillus cyri]
MKKFMLMLVSFLLLMVVTACGGNGDEEASGESGETYTLQAGHSLPEDHPYHLGFLEMAKNVEERTDGRVKIEVFPNSEIGAERELTEGMTLGTVDLVVSSTAPVTNFVPELAVLDVPFIFNDRDSAVKVLEGDVGKTLFSKMEEEGIIGLSWGENGYRHVTNSVRPIEKPADLEGLKIRTQENEIHLAAFEALGAQPTPMAWTEALTALQQGVVDAQENPAIVVDQFKLYENQKYMTLTGHVYSVAVYMMSKQTYDKLPEDLREIVMEEGKKVGAKEREMIVEMEKESLQTVKDEGMEIIEDVDTKPFQEAVKPVYEQIEHQDLLNQILDAQ